MAKKRKNKGMAKNKVLALVAIVALILIAIIVVSYSMKNDSGTNTSNGTQQQSSGTIEGSSGTINPEEAPMPADGGGTESIPEIAPSEDMPEVDEPVVEPIEE